MNCVTRAMSLDLNSLESVRKCSEELISSTKEINILVNNAGVMAIPNKEVTEDGFEKQIGINHFGHFALTGQLFDHMKKSKNARVVNVASSAHLFSAIDKEDLMLDKKGAYQAWKAYGNSKLSNILFTKELAKKLYLKSDNTLTVVCCHPGDYSDKFKPSRIFSAAKFTLLSPVAVHWFNSYPKKISFRMIRSVPDRAGPIHIRPCIAPCPRSRSDPISYKFCWEATLQ